MTLPPLLQDIRSDVDGVLEHFLAEERAQVAADHPGFLPLLDEIDRLVRGGGKRLRPMFCVLGYLAGGGPNMKDILEVAAAIELFHTFALIHDDVMDEGRTRRGEPTIHLRMAATRTDRADAERFGRSAAILAGDFAAVLADHLFLRAPFPPDVLAAAFRRYNRMRVEVAVGQFLDLAGESTPADEQEARRIASLKSGGYTVEGPLAVGAILAGAPLELMSTLARYGAPLGEAFQIRDDILGAMEERLDLAQAKPTVVLAAARSLASDEDRRFLDERLGRGAMSDQDRERAIEILRSTGAIEAARDLVSELVREAVGALGDGPVDAAAAAALRSLAEALDLPPGESPSGLPT